MCLEAVYKSLLRFIRDHIGDMDYLTTGNIDFDKMAEDDDVQHAMKVRRQSSGATRFETALTNTCGQLLVIFLMATLNTSDDIKRERYVVQIQSLDQVSQVQIMTLVEEVSIKSSQSFCCKALAKSLVDEQPQGDRRTPCQRPTTTW